jgi:hypothetical protein
MTERKKERKKERNLIAIDCCNVWQQDLPKKMEDY